MKRPAQYLKGRVDTTPEGAVLLFIGSRNPACLAPVEARRIAHLLSEAAVEAEVRCTVDDGGAS